MTNATNYDQDALLTLLENELLASADEDILAASGAAALADSVRVIVNGHLRVRSHRPPLSRRAAPRHDRRARRMSAPEAKREIVDRVLVASPKARALVANDEVGAMDEAELDQILIKLRSLGLMNEGE